MQVRIKELEAERDDWRYDAQRLADSIRVTQGEMGKLPTTAAWDWYDATRAHEALVLKYHRKPDE
jgi:hypothetical protein